MDSLVGWFAQILQTNFPEGFAPYYMHRNRTLNGRGISIIDEPETRLRSPLLNFDIENNMKSIKGMINTDAYNERAKGLVIIVQGPGAGKTRSCEELKMTLNEQDDGKCLAVAITYNSLWSLEASEFNYILALLYPSKKDDKHHIIKVGLVFSVITRMTSVLYGIPFVDSRIIYRHAIESMPLPVVDIIDFRLVLVAYIKAIVEDMRQRGQRPINSFVLFMDETKVISDRLENMGVTGTSTMLDIIRQVVLGTELQDCAELRSALVISSLVYVPSFKSNRAQTELQLPRMLDSDKVVYEWWLELLTPSVKASIIASPRDTASLRLLAALSAQLPRAVQICGELLADRLNAGETLNLKLIDLVMSELLKEIKIRYSLQVDLPPPEVMYALLFSKTITVNEYVSKLISLGILSNSLTTDSDTIVPETSVIILTFLIKNKKARGGLLNEVPYAKYILNIYNSCIEQSRSMVKEDLLEGILLNLLKAKVLCLMKCPNKPMSLISLLCMPNPSARSALTDLIDTHDLDAPLPKAASTIDSVNWVELPSVCDDEKGFYTTLSDPSHVPMASTPCTFFVSPPNATGSKNSHAVIMSCYTGPKTPPMSIVINIKSAAASSGESEFATPSVHHSDLSFMPGNGRQYINTYKHLMNATLPADIELTGMLKHIRDGKWIYIYMSNDAKYDSISVVDGGHNCIVLGPSYVYRFMGMFREVYRAARGAFETELLTQTEAKGRIMTPATRRRPKAKKE